MKNICICILMMALLALSSGCATPLNKAIHDGDVNKVTSIINAGADVNEHKRPQLTPLMYAIYRGRIEVVRLLLDNGADVNRTGSSQGPLSWAAYCGNAVAVNLLLDRGADAETAIAQLRIISSDKTLLDGNKPELAAALIERIMAERSKAAVAESRPKTMETQMTPSPSEPSTPIGPILQRWALVIGISKYRDPSVPPLQYASKDAKAFHQWLVSPQGGAYDPSRVKLLCDEQATSEAIRDALFNWLKQPIEEDLVTIYYAGHGSPESPDNLDNLFLLPYDVDYSRIGATGFPMWDIETSLKRFIRAKRVIVIADACHAAGVGQQFDLARRAGRGLKVNPITKGLGDLSAVGNSVCVLSASDVSQFSQEGERWGDGHGVFTYFLLQGLQGHADVNKDGRVTIGELTPYLSEQVRRATGSAQSPRIAGSYDPALAIGK